MPWDSITGARIQEGGHAGGTGTLGVLCVAHLLRLAREVGVDLPGAMLIYDTNITRAQKYCLVRLDPAKAHLLEILWRNAADTSVERFSDIQAGFRPNTPETPVATGCSGSRIISSPGRP